jgi:uncharacterized protein YbjT (DUF2867 family)
MARDPARLADDLRAGAVTADARDRAGVDRAIAGVDAVFSCVGASVMPVLGRGWRGYLGVDWPCNRTLVDAAKAAGTKRFVYVSVFHHEDMRALAYVDAHERVVDHLRTSGVRFGVVRPTGFHSAIAEFVDLAKKGKLPEIGDGGARTNPIADEDLAEVCVTALESEDPALAIDCGGPEILTRRQMAESAFAALGRPPRVRSMPALPIKIAAFLGRPFHPRITQFLQFLATISTRDLIAPAHGAHRLAEAFEARARLLAA